MTSSIEQGMPLKQPEQQRLGLSILPPRQPLAHFMWLKRESSTELEQLVRRVISAVMRHAQTGDLPLFAWTLGLEQDDLLALIHALFPEIEPLEPMSEAEYAVLLRQSPPLFHHLLDLLLRHQNGGTALAQASVPTAWLARALAVASLGERHFWQDLGLSHRGEVSRLLEHYFPALHARNTRDLKWKRFLYGELGQQLGQPALRPPGCHKCEQQALCFTEHKPEK